jgi:hypothetical protein
MSEANPVKRAVMASFAVKRAVMASFEIRARVRTARGGDQ